MQDYQSKGIEMINKTQLWTILQSGTKLELAPSFFQNEKEAW